MMPIKASTPRIATKPSGAPNGSSAATTPMRPSGATLTTSASFPKLCSCTIRNVAITSSITGATVSDRTLAFGGLLDGAAGLEREARRQGLAAKASIFGFKIGDHGRRLRVVEDRGAHGDCRQPVAAPDDRLLELVVELGEGEQRHDAAVRQADLQGLQRVDRVPVERLRTADRRRRGRWSRAPA